MDDLEGMSCLGAFLPFSEIVPGNTMKALGQGDADANDIAAASPGVFATDGYSPLPYTTKQFGSRGNRVQEEMSYLQKQYARMRQMQQNAVVVFSEAAVQNIQESEKRKSIPAAINHLLVSATKRKVKATRNHFGTEKKSNQTKAVQKSLFDEIASHKAEVKQNAYEKESLQHLNMLFKGDQKERKEAQEDGKTRSFSKKVETERTEGLVSAKKVHKEEKRWQSEERRCHVEPPIVKKEKRVAPNSLKMQHVGLNGEVSSLETGKSKKNGGPILSIVNPSNHTPKVTVVESSMLTVTEGNNEAAKPVKVLDKNSPAVLDTGTRSFGGTGRVYNRGTMNSTVNSSWLLEEDRRCKYPENFRPFPQRNKQPTRSRILYGNISDKGAKRMDAFQVKKDNRQSVNGVAVNGGADGKRN